MGVGAALISGAGLAAADSGDSIGGSSRTPSASKLDTPDPIEPRTRYITTWNVGTQDLDTRYRDTRYPLCGSTDKPRQPRVAG